MIDAEMYGMMFSAKIVMRRKAPPANMSNMPSRPPPDFWNASARACGSTPGIGIQVPRR